MSEPQPTFDNIFTPEYWGRIHRIPLQSKSSMISGEAMRQASRFCLEAAVSVFEDMPRQSVLKGSRLNPGSDGTHNELGTVMLTDREVLIPMSRNDSWDTDYFKGVPFHRDPYIRNEEELAAQPAYLFRRNSNRVILPDGSERFDVYPYIKAIPNHETRTVYGRMIGLVCLIPEKKGKTRLKFCTRWGFEKNENPPIRGVPTKLRHYRLALAHNQSIGDTYRDRKGSEFMRIKGLEICMRGLFELSPKEVRQKQKARPLVQWTTRPSFQ